MALKKLERNYVNDTIDNEGFDYAFCDYTDFNEIEDAEFHRLREAYVAASKALKAYIE
jgi:hypothetical protein